MLTAVRNQCKVIFLSIKYALMRELLNKTTFISNIIFMILNNSSMIVQWIVLFSIKDNFGGYTLKHVILLIGISSSLYGFAHFFFEKSFKLSETINSGKLDAYIVQPKNILLSTITSDIQVSALGDLSFGLIAYFIYGFTIQSFILYCLFTITGGIILVCISVILHSLSFWFSNADAGADTFNGMMINISTYPDSIFKGIVKWLLFTIIPVGIANYIPVKVIVSFNPYLLLINVGVCLLFILLAFTIFYRGLKKYSSTNLMAARV